MVPAYSPFLGWRFWEPYIFICFYFGIGALIYPIGWFLSIVQTLPVLVGKTGKELHGSEELAKEEMREIMISKGDG
mgnify:FL=1